MRGETEYRMIRVESKDSLNPLISAARSLRFKMALCSFKQESRQVKGAKSQISAAL